MEEIDQLARSKMSKVDVKVKEVGTLYWIQRVCIGQQRVGYFFLLKCFDGEYSTPHRNMERLRVAYYILLSQLRVSLARIQSVVGNIFAFLVGKYMLQRVSATVCHL